jgi:hypothetical protein
LPKPFRNEEDMMRRRMKTLRIIIMTMLLGIVAVTPANAQGEVAVTINAPTQVDSGSDFTAIITIGSVTDLNAVQYDVSFNPSVLQLNDITSGQIGSTKMAVMSREVKAGTYRVVQSLGLSTVDGSGSLAVLHFHALQSGEADTSLSNGVLAGFEGAIGAEWTGSSIIVGSGAPPYSPPASNPQPTLPSSSPPSSPTTPDIKQPKVVNTSPKTGATEVPVTSMVKATFDKDMNSNTMNTSSFRLAGSSPVNGKVSYDATTKIATFTPEINLEWGTRYTVTLSSGIVDTVGKQLTGMSWSFTTQQAPAEEDAGNAEVTAPQTYHPDFTGWIIIGVAICVMLILLMVFIRLIRRRTYYGY